MDLNLPRSQTPLSQCKFARKESCEGENGRSSSHGPWRFITRPSLFARSPLFAPEEETGIEFCLTLH